jgi:hypothetical protein
MPITGAECLPLPSKSLSPRGLGSFQPPKTFLNSLSYFLKHLPKRVRIVFKQSASWVNKTKHAVSYLNERHASAYGFPDIFYHRLNVLLSMREKLSYRKIDALVKLLQEAPSLSKRSYDKNMRFAV